MDTDSELQNNVGGGNTEKSADSGKTRNLISWRRRCSVREESDVCVEGRRRGMKVRGGSGANA